MAPGAPALLYIGLAYSYLYYIVYSRFYCSDLYCVIGSNLYYSHVYHITYRCSPPAPGAPALRRRGAPEPAADRGVVEEASAYTMNYYNTIKCDQLP